MHPSVRIRSSQPADAPRLAVLAAQVWLHTYATDGVSDEVAGHVLAEFTPARFLQRLGEPATQLLVAEQGESLIGFAVLKAGEACPAEAAGSTVELQTLYVQEHHIGRGVGKALIEAAQAAALERAGSVLWLTVNARNGRAIAFYARQGYTQVGTTWFVLGQGRHENHVLLGPSA